ncbi:MAG: DinB family protein [Dehalococcoidia bacterium]
MAELSEEQLRVRGYLQAQAAKLTVKELMAKVLADSEVLKSAAAAADSIDYTKRPGADSWSVHEVLAHVTDSGTRVNAGILSAVQDGRPSRPLQDALQATGDIRRPMEWWDTLAAERASLFKRLQSATGDEHLDVKWDHPFFGDLNWREWLLFLRLHDGDHARQVEGIVAALK